MKRRALYPVLMSGAVAAAAPEPPVATYADFVTAMEALSTSGAAAWGNEVASAGSYRTTAAAETGNLFGSSWNNAFRRASSSVCRAIQHGLPSYSVFQDQVAGSRLIFFRLVAGPNTALPAVLRNNFESSDVSAVDTWQMDLLIRWDDTLKKAFQSNPSIGGAETEYPL